MVSELTGKPGQAYRRGLRAGYRGSSEKNPCKKAVLRYWWKVGYNTALAALKRIDEKDAKETAR